MRPFATNHRRWLVRGSAAALVVVASRLALPWPLQALLTPWLQPTGQSSLPSSWLPAGLNPVMAMGGLFLLFLLVLGLADLLERVYFARFAIGATRDLRAAAFRVAVQLDPSSRSAKPGDIVTRLVSDIARIKGGLKGFLVHVATNGVMFAGVTLVLFWMDVAIGLAFAIAGILAVIVTLLCARWIYDNSLKYRKKEGKRANAIQRALVGGPKEGDFAAIKDSPGYHKASITKVQGIATCLTHGIFGVAVLVSFWIGGQAVLAGRLQPSHIVVFAVYALMMRGPVVRLARQGARTGKILAGSDRLVSLLRKEREQPDSTARNVRPLRHAIQLVDVTVKGSKAQGRRPRLGPVSLEFSLGERVAVLGPPGSGKTTLLELIGGIRRPLSGSMLWDGVDLAGARGWDLAAHVAYMPQQPAWLRRSIRELLDLPAGVLDPSAAELMQLCGLDELTSRLSAGLDTELSSDDLSPGERRLLAVARCLWQTRTIRLFDDPVTGLPDDVAQLVLTAALQSREQALIIVAMSQPVALELFDTVIELEAGQIMVRRSVAMDGRHAAEVNTVHARHEGNCEIGMSAGGRRS